MIRMILVLCIGLFASSSYAVGYSYDYKPHELFRSLDIDKNGQLERHEVPPMIEFDLIDADRTQAISFEEFSRVYRTPRIDLFVPYKASKQTKQRKPMQAFKTTLSTLSKELERQGFMSGKGSRFAQVNPNLTLKPLTDFMSWAQNTPEVRETLEKMGVAWVPPANAKTLGVDCPVQVVSADDVSDFGEWPLVGRKGTVTLVDTQDNGATPDDPLFVVLLEDGRTEGFWTEQLAVISA